MCWHVYMQVCTWEREIKILINIHYAFNKMYQNYQYQILFKIQLYIFFNRKSEKWVPSLFLYTPKN